jgi:hypothetical protein
MLGTRLNRSAVGKTQVSVTVRRSQRLAPPTPISLLACPDAPCQAMLRYGDAGWRFRSPPSLRDGPAPRPACASYPSIQSTLKQKPCQSRLRPPPLYPQGRQGLGRSRARPRPCGYKILQKGHASTGGQNPSAVARARCQSEGSLSLDVPRSAHDSSCPSVKNGLQQTVRLNRCRRRRLIIRTDCRVARVGPTTPTRVWDTGRREPPPCPWPQARLARAGGISIGGKRQELRLRRPQTPSWRSIM